MSEDLTALTTEQLLLAFRRLPVGVNKCEMKQLESFLEEARRRDAQFAERERASRELYAALHERQKCTLCGGSGTRWTLIGEEAEPDACDCWIEAHEVLTRYAGDFAQQEGEVQP